MTIGCALWAKGGGPGTGVLALPNLARGGASASQWIVYSSDVTETALEFRDAGLTATKADTGVNLSFLEKL